jgi:hypothetical protein
LENRLYAVAEPVIAWNTNESIAGFLASPLTAVKF